MSTCPKIGIKIHETPSSSSSSTNVKYFNTRLNELDLDLDNYSLHELFALFNIQSNTLNSTLLKDAKNIVLKMHPDKSNLDSKYFLFFSSAYKRLFSIYEFQNKSEKKVTNIDYVNMNEEEHTHILNATFTQNQHLKKPKDFNNWFNEQFNKYGVDDHEAGYGEWLKTDDGNINVQNVSQTNMNAEFEKQKKQIQLLVTYTGVSDTIYSSTLGGSILNHANEYSSGLFNDGNIGYTDLKQAYSQTLIPVTQDDYNNIKKFKNVNEYNAYREKQDMTPINEHNALKQLETKNNSIDKEGTALAYKFAQELEQNKRKLTSFWGNLQMLGNGNL